MAATGPNPSTVKVQTLTPAETLSLQMAGKPTKRKKSKHKPVVKCGIRELRDSLNLTLDDVATAVGMSKAGLWKIELGSDCQITSALKLAKFFGRKISELWGEL